MKKTNIPLMVLVIMSTKVLYIDKPTQKSSPPSVIRIAPSNLRKGLNEKYVQPAACYMVTITLQGFSTRDRYI